MVSKFVKSISPPKAGKSPAYHAPELVEMRQVFLHGYEDRSVALERTTSANHVSSEAHLF